MDLKGMGWVDVDCIQLAQARNQSRAVVDRVMNHSVAQDSGMFLPNVTAISYLEGIFYGFNYILNSSFICLREEAEVDDNEEKEGKYNDNKLDGSS